MNVEENLVDNSLDESCPEKGAAPYMHHALNVPISVDGTLSPRPSGTLLPRPMARAVSFVARTTSFALRIGTTIGGYSLGAAKVTTLSSLELGRGILDGILSRAGRDVFLGSQSELARADAESVLETNLEILHQTMTRIVFWTSACFHAAGTTVSTASQISQLLLSVLDQFFGSTDSSKAIASIITLIRREFQNPATGAEGERVGVTDLILGLCGLAYLQTRCRKLIQEEYRSLGYEEVIWDVVVVNDGERIDTIQEGIRHVDGTHFPPYSHSAHVSPDEWDDDNLIERQLRQKIAKSLPSGAELSISSSTITTKTVTVDIKGPPGMPIPSCPGIDVVQSEVSNPPATSPDNREQLSSYRIVYRVSRNRVRNMADMGNEGRQDRLSVEELSGDDGVEFVPPVAAKPQDASNPQPPPKAVGPTVPSLAKGPGINTRKESPKSQTTNSSYSMNESPQTKSLGGAVQKEIESIANQKRTRKPVDELQQPNKNHPATIRARTGSSQRKTDRKPLTSTSKAGEKKTGVRKALKKRVSGSNLANMLGRDPSSENVTGLKSKSNARPPWGSYKPTKLPRLHTRGHSSISSLSPTSPGRHEPPPQRRPSSAHGGRRGSVVSTTDTLSIHSFNTQSPPPTPYAAHQKPSPTSTSNSVSSALRVHTRGHSQTHNMRPSSIYTLATRESEGSLPMPSSCPKSAYRDSAALGSLRMSGEVCGMYPKFHFLRNITRYSRFASAVYGHNFLKLMGISKDRPLPDITDEIHYDIRSFAHHTKLPPHSILLSSFVDPQGGSDSTGATDTGIPLVHTVALDEESKAVVLSCRGTLGFEDVLADMMCEYDDLVWMGNEYQVHKGIHASARRLLYGGDGRVMITLKAALEKYPDYGLVLCGHSLGGGVTALLGAMLAEPSMTGTGFVTSAAGYLPVLNDAGPAEAPIDVCLPPGRPIHVYAYGAPATMSPSLQKATRGLITGTVHGNDMVPYLSLGVLHDFQALALAFKTDNNEAKAEVKRRVWEGLRVGLVDRWYNSATKQGHEEDDTWVYVALKTLRVSMMSSKLLPPGEVFAVETTDVMRRDPFARPNEDNIGRPAKRIVLKYIRDVEAYFREVRFGASMLIDHSPGRYEDALRRLSVGIMAT
ncbi:hypothetical protein GGS20DRAFT_545681 [Poronia punctata]|nr:hypothetical protein GGS20DRAFT_545681 [Poronia punctata]